MMTSKQKWLTGGVYLVVAIMISLLIYLYSGNDEVAIWSPPPDTPAEVMVDRGERIHQLYPMIKVMSQFEAWANSHLFYFGESDDDPRPFLIFHYSDGEKGMFVVNDGTEEYGGIINMDGAYCYLSHCFYTEWVGGRMVAGVYKQN